VAIPINAGMTAQQAIDRLVAVDGKVDQVTGKALSANDYTDLEKARLASTVDTVAGRSGDVTLAKGDVGLGNVDNTTDLGKPISTAQQTALDGKIDDGQVLTNVPAGAVFTDTVYSKPLAEPISYITALQSALDAKVDDTEKGSANGIATLDSGGLVPSTQLPAYVDDVLEFANLAGFPASGATGKIYVALDTNKTYRWSGSAYIYITSGAVDSVNGNTGVVTLVKADVGLGSVDNTTDVAKPVSTAQQTALDLKLANVVEDTTPQLGGELNAGAHSIGFVQQTATGDGATTVDWKLGNKMKFTFGAFDETFTFTAPSNPCNLLMVIIQDATGGRNAVWPASVKWLGTQPAWTVGGISKGIVVSFYFDGTTYWGQGTPWEV
jgi:hypothetical protein